MASSRTLVDRELWVVRRLTSDIRYHGAELSDANAAQIVSLGPTQWRSRHQAVAVGETRACTFQPLHESRDVGDGRELQNHVDVICNDARREHARAVTSSLLR